jgi:dipeptidyl-peptidase-4
MERTALAGLALALLTLPAPSQTAPAPQEPEPTAEAKLTLEELFPEKGLFGPSASGMAVSRSGRFAAWLHRPFVERRHGNDIYLLDLATGQVQRLTDVALMAPFQRSARRVDADRDEKAAKAAKKSGEPAAAAEPSQAQRNMDADARVQDTDADDEKAPRYAGITSFLWSPTGQDEFLFLSERDLYRYEVDADRIERLTRSSSGVSRPAWLPDGTGYTYLEDGHLVRVRFGSHVHEELQPDFPRGEELTSYALSPDGQRAVLVTRQRSGGSEGRTVKIARYTDRFMDVREVPRTVSDDPVPEATTRFYLYELAGVMHENGPLVRFHAFEASGPRDVVRTPAWAPDSTRVVFATFEQESSQVTILESVFPNEARFEELRKERTKDAAAKDDKGAWELLENPAKPVYRFLHDGGPNTPRMIEPEYLADSRHVLFLGEQSGFRHLHVLDPLYQSQRQLTSGTYEVYPLRLAHDRQSAFVAATREHPATLDVYRVDVATGAMVRMTTGNGVHDGAAVSDTGHVLSNFASWETGPTELIHTAPEGAATTLTDSHPDKARSLTARAPELFAYPNRNGQQIHGFLFEPARDEGELRPLLIYVYGGPLGTRKNVVQGTYQSDAYMFARYMTEVHGYVTCTIDPRGMSGYGALFEKANFEQVGRPQVEDLVDGVRHLIATRGVDADRVGIHGWSFGGFQTQMCLYTEPKVFRVGMAGAGPTEWHNYNSWYSTGTIGPSREGKTDLDKYSLLPLAKNLEGRLLLVHGMEDSNVLYQDTVRVYRELLKAGKESLVELFLDPTGGHGLGGDVKRLGKARKYEDFLKRTLGSVSLADSSAGR